jgi:predicted peptidase
VRALALALVLAGCSGGGRAGERLDFAIGLHERTLPLAGGGLLRYTLIVPDSDPGRPRPLVLALHFGGTVTPFYGRNVLELLVAPALGELGAVMVAPDALEQGWDQPANEAAVLALLDDLAARLNLDRHRTLCTGYSMGGTGTWYLAGRHPDRFTAAIPIAGRPVPAPRWTVPVYVIHGRGDQVVPFAPAEAEVARLKAAGVEARLVAVDGATHYQTDRFVEPLHAAVPWVRAVWDR